MLQEVNIKYRDRQNTETIYLPNSCPHCGNIHHFPVFTSALSFFGKRAGEGGTGQNSTGGGGGTGASSSSRTGGGSGPSGLRVV